MVGPCWSVSSAQLCREGVLAIDKRREQGQQGSLRAVGRGGDHGQQAELLLLEQAEATVGDDESSEHPGVMKHVCLMKFTNV